VNREKALFSACALLAYAGKAPALKRQLKGIDIARLRTRADLARRAGDPQGDIKAMQQALPPFAGLVADRTAGADARSGVAGADLRAGGRRA
jgi:hypothetical protein